MALRTVLISAVALGLGAAPGPLGRGEIGTPTLGCLEALALLDQAWATHAVRCPTPLPAVLELRTDGGWVPSDRLAGCRNADFRFASRARAFEVAVHVRLQPAADGGSEVGVLVGTQASPGSAPSRVLCGEARGRISWVDAGPRWSLVPEGLPVRPCGRCEEVRQRREALDGG